VYDAEGDRASTEAQGKPARGPGRCSSTGVLVRRTCTRVAQEPGRSRGPRREPERRSEARSERRREHEKSECRDTSDEVGEPTRGTLRSKELHRDMEPSEGKMRETRSSLVELRTPSPPSRLPPRDDISPRQAALAPKSAGLAREHRIHARGEVRLCPLKSPFMHARRALRVRCPGWHGDPDRSRCRGGGDGAGRVRHRLRDDECAKRRPRRPRHPGRREGSAQRL